MRRLKRAGNLDAAETILLRATDAMEAEARAERWDVARRGRRALGSPEDA